MKYSPADIAFSKCVRERNDWTCECCGSKFAENSMGLHCSHVFSRRHRTIRWAGDNAQALCFSCHQWYGGNPAESGAWVSKLLGEGKISSLIERKESRFKVPKSEEAAIARHYKAQLKAMKKKRSEGQTGRVEFESWQ